MSKANSKLRKTVSSEFNVAMQIVPQLIDLNDLRAIWIDLIKE
jgi:hypothetical protein